MFNANFRRPFLFPLISPSLPLFVDTECRIFCKQLIFVTQLHAICGMPLAAYMSCVHWRQFIATQ
jgi:hypothetical protein